MIDLNNLNAQFNLSNPDLAQLTKALSQNQNMLIKIVLIAATLGGGFYIYNDYHTKDQALHKALTEAQHKLDAIKLHDQTFKEMADFKSTLPKNITETELIVVISQYAKSNNVVINSLSPAQSKDMGLYDAISLNFSAESDDFKAMMLFLRKIEKSEYPLTITSWSGHELTGGRIAFNLVVTAVIIHP